jgi:S1-C subfamily serine protease
LMSIKKGLSDNILWILVAIVAINFLIVYWGTVNWGLYGARNSTLAGDLLQRRNLSLQDPLRVADGAASPNLVLTRADDDLASAFASVRPAVVSITADRVTQRKAGSLAGSVSFDDPSIRFVQEPALGSGIVVDPRGFIVTNAHVVSRAQNIKVLLFGFERREYAAEIVRKDLSNDIAILKIHPEGPIPAAVLGDSDMVRVAERVLAVGSPFGLEHTVTAGIISDDSRDLVIEGQTYKDMLQTDAAINRGNSGGALVNLRGEVVGMNTAIYAPTGVFTGVGFAIPINRVKPIVKETLGG